VAGVVGATTESNIVLLSGVAELFAGTISMAVGSYQASKSELEVIERQNKKEQIKGKTSQEEMEDLIRFYENEGFKRAEAEAIAKRIFKEKEHPFQISDFEKLGLSPKKLGNPVKSGTLCGLFFGLAALVPIFAFVIPLNIWEAMIISIIASMICLFGVGAIKTIFSRKNWVWSGLEMMAIGASAAAITYVIGTLFSIIL
jgi:VIT1/CCC1 family predicted Fe2+/Mn2+ transporter